MALWRRVRRKVLKRWARNAFFPRWRLTLLRWCGVEIGAQVYIADGIMIVEELDGQERVVIGDRVSIAPRVTLVTSSHPNHSAIRAFAPVSRGDVRIDADAWIGAGAVILPGVRIGRGAVIGALTVVAQDVEPYHVMAGHPARAIRVLQPDSPAS